MTIHALPKSKQSEVVELLERALSDAKAGKVRAALLFTDEFDSIQNTSGGLYTIGDFLFAFERWKWRVMTLKDEEP